MDAALNVFLFLFHTGLIVFNAFGWLWKKTRRANLACLLLTGGSWFGLGLCYGIGYCPFTEWHWRVRERLGYGGMPASYMKFLVDAFTGADANAALVDGLTALGFFAALAASVAVNVRDWRSRRM